MIEQKQAIKDMIDFIAEFELWLEGQVLTEDDGDDYWVISPSVHATFREVLDKYRECKKRIEYHDEQSAHVLTAEQAEVVEHLQKYNTGNSGDSVVYDNKPTITWLTDVGYIIMGYKSNFDLQVLVVTDTGRAALKAYQGTHNDE